MNSLNILGFFVVLIFFGLMIAVAILIRQKEAPKLREIAAFKRLGRAIGLAVEAGSRLHVSLGRGQMLSRQSAIGFVGLSILDRIGRSTSISDRPPIATSGEGTLGILTQDSQRVTAKYLGVESDPTRGRITGVTPYSYAAGTLLFIEEEEIGANLLIGSFGNEAALITDAAERKEGMTLGGTDNLAGQAVLFAAAQEPLIGEESYAGGAYLGAGRMHIASIYVQDIFRWVLIGFILLGALLKLFGVL
ncbi:MAG: hypothetical protein JJE12_00510 [Anaerolineales bacterium]|nr:hypothetical protein [Anaerolineales bacterium]